MKKAITRILFALLGIYLLILASLYVMQRRLMFAANPTRIQLDQADLPGVTEVIMETHQGDKLICWHGLAKPGRPTFAIFHGNGGNIGWRGDIFRELMTKGYGVFMLGYPGYGGSDGSPSETAFMEAADLSYAHLRQLGIPANDIVIFGESLGTSVATQLAARQESLALVLVAPMESVLHVAQSQYPYIPVKWLLKDPFRTDLHIGKVDEPLLIVHGSNDDVIPIDNSRTLFKLANEPKSLEIIERGGHNDLFDFSIVNVIDRFLNQNANATHLNDDNTQ